MTSSIKNYKYNCTTCSLLAPSHQVEPIIITPFPEWLFQQICADFFVLHSHTYLIIVDRYSGWITIYHFKQGNATSLSIQNILRQLFTNFGVPDELSTDGGPQFTATSFRTFLEVWGLHHRISSVEYPQSNGRAEAAVKSAKRIIFDYTSANGDLNNNKAAQATLQYRNTPLQDCNLSPAQILFHRKLQDTIPSHLSNYKLHPEWLAAAQHRENEYTKKHLAISTEYDRHAKELPQLSLGSLVLIQGKDKRWKKQGKIIDILDHRQYRIRLLGSGGTNLRNRRFLRACTHINPTLGTEWLPQAPPSPEKTNLQIPVQKQQEESQGPESFKSSVEEEPLTPEVTTFNGKESSKPYIPRALKNIQSFNKPGLKE